MSRWSTSARGLVVARTGLGGSVGISGSATYRQRIALPPGAGGDGRPVGRVGRRRAVHDRRPAGDHAGAPGADPVLADGQRAALVERRTYALSAQITVDGVLRWTSDTHVFVTASGPLSGLDIVVVPA